MTPEGKVKATVKTLLNTYEGLYQFWPVPTGYGKATLDVLCSHRGTFFAIETKRPGGKPTPRQLLSIREIEASGAQAFVVDGPERLSQLKDFLDALSATTPGTSKSEA